MTGPSARKVCDAPPPSPGSARFTPGGRGLTRSIGGARVAARAPTRSSPRLRLSGGLAGSAIGPLIHRAVTPADLETVLQLDRALLSRSIKCCLF